MLSEFLKRLGYDAIGLLEMNEDGEKTKTYGIFK